MSLNARLTAIRARATEEVRAAYDEFLQRMDAAQVAAQALQPGAPMPAFLLPNAEGRLVHSDDLLAHGPLIVTFIRGQWCPYCAMTLDALEAALPGIVANGATLVAMTPETGGRALLTQQQHGLNYQILVDVDLAVAMEFGIVFKTPPLYGALLNSRGIDIAARSGNPAWLLPVPATFLIAQNGTIARAWVNPDFTHRPEPEEILSALQTLPRQT